jgi:hypothetical protein
MKQLNTFVKIFVLSSAIQLTMYSFLSSQNIHYVSMSGNNTTGNGSIGNPYATLQFALSLVEDHDTIVLRGGNYQSDEIRIERNDITIRSYPDEWAIITAPTTNSEIASCIWYNEPEIQGGVLERLEIIGGYYYAIKFESNWDWGYPISDRRGVSNITVKNCKIHDSGRDCLKLTPACDNITIESCSIYNSGIGPANISNPNAEGIDVVNCDNLIVRNCYIHDISTTGIYSKGGSINTFLDGNLVMNCGSQGILLGFYTDEEWFDSIANPNMYENIDGLAINNIVINTQYEGIGMYAALNPRFYNNTIVNAALNSHASLFINTGYIWSEAINDMIWPPCRNIEVRNNIFYNEVSSSEPMAQIRYYDDDPTTNMLGNCIIDNNLYYNPGGASFDNGIDWQALDFSLWKSSTSFDLSSFETDPFLDNNYHLNSNSPCINTGYMLPSVINDYDGGTRIGLYDMGADEYNAGIILVVPPDGINPGTGTNPLTSIFSHDKSEDLIKTSVYPNPLSLYSDIYVQLEKPEIISITITDLTGKIVVSVFSGQLEKGEHSFNVSAKNLESGIYYCNVESNFEKLTKKLLIVK